MDWGAVDPLEGQVERRGEDDGSPSSVGQSTGRDGASDETGCQQVQGHRGENPSRWLNGIGRHAESPGGTARNDETAVSCGVPVVDRTAILFKLIVAVILPQADVRSTVGQARQK